MEKNLSEKWNKKASTRPFHVKTINTRELLRHENKREEIVCDKCLLGRPTSNTAVALTKGGADNEESGKYNSLMASPSHLQRLISLKSLFLFLFVNHFSRLILKGIFFNLMCSLKINYSNIWQLNVTASVVIIKKI